jgi:hypothetical protein
MLLQQSQRGNDELLPFRIDLCDWLNGMLSPAKPLEEATLLQTLSDGVMLCELANLIDDEEVQLRKDEDLESRASFSKPGFFADHPATPRRSSISKATTEQSPWHVEADASSPGKRGKRPERRGSASSSSDAPKSNARLGFRYVLTYRVVGWVGGWEGGWVGGWPFGRSHQGGCRVVELGILWPFLAFPSICVAASCLLALCASSSFGLLPAHGHGR